MLYDGKNAFAFGKKLLHCLAHLAFPLMATLGQYIHVAYYTGAVRRLSSDFVEQSPEK